MKTVPAAGTQTSSTTKALSVLAGQAEVKRSEVPQRADGRGSELKADEKNHFQHVQLLL